MPLFVQYEAIKVRIMTFLENLFGSHAASQTCPHNVHMVNCIFFVVSQIFFHKIIPKKILRFVLKKSFELCNFACSAKTQEYIMYAAH